MGKENITNNVHRFRNIDVYTCVTDGYDNLELFNDSKFINDINIRYTIFTDVNINIKGWNILPLCYTENTNVKVARWHKTHPHILFPDSDITIWIDGNQIPIGNISYLLESAPFGVLKHQYRNCICSEVLACDRLKKDKLSIMETQINKYLLDGYPINNGLGETCYVVRENNYANSVFNESWWGEIATNSHRDQLSFDYIMWKLKMGYNHIIGNRTDSLFLKFVGEH